MFVVGGILAGCRPTRQQGNGGIASDYIVPDWYLRLRAQDCVQPNTMEDEQAALALRSLELFGDAGWMSIGAKKYFSLRRYRTIGLKSQEICAPADLYPRLTEVLITLGVFDRARLSGDEVDLVRMIGPRDPRIIEAVGRTAFSKIFIPSGDGLKKDVRIMARIVLAEFGRSAQAFGERAFNEMSADTPLGTGAAQIAVAVGYPGALDKTEQLMAYTLRRNHDPIPREVRNRLFEPAFAIAFAGPEGRDHLDPVYALLGRRVESWAPPYGTINLEPTTMCFVLRYLGGSRADAHLAQPPCNAEKLVLPG